MKKLLCIIVCFFIFSINIEATNKIEVKFSKCVDGDTADFVLNGEIIKARLLAIDTPETKHPTKGVEPYGKEASEFTCNLISNTKKIYFEYDDNSDIKDKYGRYLVWLWVDDELLQSKLIEKGYAKVAYLYDDYKYTKTLEKIEKEAKEKKLGIWSNIEEDDTNSLIIIIIGIIIIILSYVFSSSYRKKIKKKFKKEVKKLILK